MLYSPPPLFLYHASDFVVTPRDNIPSLITPLTLLFKENLKVDNFFCD